MKVCRVCGGTRQSKNRTWTVLGDAQMIAVLRGVAYVKTGTRGVHAHLQCIKRVRKQVEGRRTPETGELK